MLNPDKHGLQSKPSFEQLKSQGLIYRPKYIQSTETPTGDDFLIADSKIRPNFPQEGQWISLIDFSDEMKLSLSNMLNEAQSNGVIFVKHESGSINAYDYNTCEGYVIIWYWQDVSGIGNPLTDTPKEKRLREAAGKIPEHGSVQKIKAPLTIDDIIPNKPVLQVMKVGDKVIVADYQSSITHVSFDLDTLFEHVATVKVIKEHQQNLMNALIKKLP